MTTLRLTTPIDDAETRMRRALDLGTPSAGSGGRDQTTDPRSARRFSQAGDVAVTRLPGRKDPVAIALSAAETALAAERGLRERAEAALVHAQAAIVALQTKLAHAELAHADELAAERRLSQERIDELALSEQRKAEPPPVASAAPIKAPEDGEPVQWWVPGWQGDYRGR